MSDAAQTLALFNKTVRTSEKCVCEVAFIFTLFSNPDNLFLIRPAKKPKGVLNISTDMGITGSLTYQPSDFEEGCLVVFYNRNNLGKHPINKIVSYNSQRKVATYTLESDGSIAEDNGQRTSYYSRIPNSEGIHVRVRIGPSLKAKPDPSSPPPSPK